jgi:hypothetical protein
LEERRRVSGVRRRVSDSGEEEWVEENRRMSEKGAGE